MAGAKRARRAARFGRQTFASAAEAARDFYEGNALFFDHVQDPIDGLRAWADGIDVSTGRRTSRRLAESAAGRKIFEARQGEPQILAALRWVFQQAKGRRWDAVQWDAIESLGESLAPYFMHPDRGPATAGLHWRPMVGAGKPVAERLDELDPHDALELGAAESAAELAAAVDELRETFVETRECLSPRLRAVVERRIAEWSRWVADPQRIPDYACEPDAASDGYVCNYPLVLGELRELRGACRGAYNPDWFASESDAEAAGFPPPPADPRGPAPLPEEDGAAAGERGGPETPGEAPAELGAPACPSEDLRQLQTDGRAYGSNSETIEETRTVGAVFYQLEWRVSKWGTGHRRGPYWYGYWRDEGGRRRSRYIGRKFFEIDVGR